MSRAAPRRLPPYPKATWADWVESVLRRSIGIAIALALFCDGTWWAVAGLVVATFGWSAGLEFRRSR